METSKKIREQVQIPKLGTPLHEMPLYTKKMLDIFNANLTPKQIKMALTDNHHQIPKSAFINEKINYEAANTFDDYLKDLHHRNIEELEKHFKENRVWFEQEINEDVINFVKSNQEILSAKRIDNQLYVTKIPYDTKAYLSAKTKEDKNFHVCHCPFIKSIFLENGVTINPTWCNCSGGFTKFPFDVLFDKTLDVTCIETPLKGDDLCRFVILLNGIDFKK